MAPSGTAADQDERRRLEAALREAPGHLPTRLALARCLRRLDEPEAVLALLPTGGGAAAAMRAQARMDLGDLPGAAAALAEAGAGLPARRARLRLAALGFDAAAERAAAEAVLAVAPDDAEAGRARLRAEVLAFRPDAARGLAEAATGVARLDGTLGAIANEMRLRPDSTAALAAAAEGPPERLLEVARSWLARGEDSIGPALGLLRALARLGRLPAPGQGEGRAIPRTLHLEAAPGEPIAPRLAAARAHAPGFVLRVWDAEAAAAFDAAAPPALRAALRALPTAAARAALRRLALLRAEGGAWIGPGLVPAKPLAPLLGDAPVVLQMGEFGAIGGGFLAAAPGAPLLAAGFDEALDAAMGGAGEGPWLALGPGLLTRLAARALAAGPPPGLALLPRMLPGGALRRRRAPAP